MSIQKNHLGPTGDLIAFKYLGIASNIIEAQTLTKSAMPKTRTKLLRLTFAVELACFLSVLLLSVLALVFSAYAEISTPNTNKYISYLSVVACIFLHVSSLVKNHIYFNTRLLPIPEKPD